MNNKKRLSVNDEASSYIDSIFELLKPDVIGFYNQFEVVTIFALPKSGKVREVFNILTILVAKEELTDECQLESFLTPSLLNIQGIKDLSFGVVRYSVDMLEARSLLINLIKTQVWTANNKSLMCSSQFESIPKIFVPSDSTETVPLNNILKNNFWSGSHVFELFDTTKSKLQFLFDQPELLQNLSAQIQKIIPIKLASVSDRLGNFIIQLPVSIVIANISRTQQGNALTLKLGWHPKATAESKNLIFNCVRLDDRTCQDFFSCRVEANEVNVPMEHERGAHRYYLWDDDKKILLSASAKSSFIHEITMNSAMLENEPRVFYLKNNGSEREKVSINIVNNMPLFDVNKNGVVSRELSDTWIERRLYTHEKTDLLNNKILIQYSRNQSEKAFDDLRALIQRHGQESVYLWDPYLAPQDILRTLFYCPYAGSDLRAITGLILPPETDSQSKINLIKEYGEELEASCKNKFGLRIELRAKFDKYGWSFHDRFLIFPKTTSGARAWSLGTSVNSLGKAHHIFQEVSDGRLIADAFETLWNSLDHQDCCVWKS